MHNLSFLRGWVVFLSKKLHFFNAKLQFLGGWVLFLSKKTTFFEIFQKMCAKALKGTSLARCVPKPLKAPSLARSVPKPLKVPSLARSVPKPLKEPSLARSVLKPFKRSRKGGGGCQAALFFVPRDSLTLCCRPPTPLVVGSVPGTTPPSQL